MSFIYKKKLISPEELSSALPMSAQDVRRKKERDQEIRDIFSGRSDKFLVIMGPCSADHEDAVCDYVSRLAEVQEKVSSRILIIPRVFTNKPRTTGLGYKGIAHQPDPEKEPDLQEGLIAMRRLHLRVLAETGLTTADEMLYLEIWPYVEDLLSYVVIGARSVENQPYRFAVSGMDCPAGMKNPTSGDFSVMLNSCLAAQSSHTFIYRGYEVSTSGNPFTHCILRGAIDQDGQYVPNYHYEDLIRLHEMYAKYQLANPAVIIDANHANSGKIYSEQPRIVKEVLYSRSATPELAQLVKGVMIESYIEAGRQDISGRNYGQSLTDACLGWKESERLIYTIAEHV
ncbi:MAG: 3-deoxy-7-phosphoheptulonate synthase [Peptococcaceae bacterium]|nr:3-deoxy-7-phosphoheptulonate synthase [Peptococcaceae bacterium]